MEPDIVGYLLLLAPIFVISMGMMVLAAIINGIKLWWERMLINITGMASNTLVVLSIFGLIYYFAR